MKKVLMFALLIVLALSLLTACGGGNSGNSNSDGAPANDQEDTQASAPAETEVIYPSALLSIDEAGSILGAKMLDVNFSGNKIDARNKTVLLDTPYMECEYMTEDATVVNVSLFQHQEENSAWVIETIEKSIENPSEDDIALGVNYEVLDGIGDKAYLYYRDNGNVYATHIFCGDYYLNVFIRGDSYIDSAWGEAKVVECSKFALEHLKEILAGKRSPERNVPVSALATAVNAAVQKATTETVMPSMLLSLEEVEAITGASMQLMEGDKINSKSNPGSVSSMYISEQCALGVSIQQDVLTEESGSKRIEIADHIVERMATMELLASADPSKAIKLEGLGDGAYYLNMDGSWTLNFYYGAYWITLSCFSSQSPQWQQEKLLEAGNLMVEHLKAIIG